MSLANRPSEIARRVALTSLAAFCLGLISPHRVAGADEGPSPKAYLEFVRERAGALAS